MIKKIISCILLSAAALPQTSQKPVKQLEKKSKYTHVLVALLSKKNIKQILLDYLDHWQCYADFDMRHRDTDRTTAVHFNQDNELIVGCGQYLAKTGSGLSWIQNNLALKISTLAITDSPDRKFTASASDDGRITLWHQSATGFIESFDEICSGHMSNIISLAFSPCSKYIASASGDGVIKIWDCILGLNLKTMKVPTALDVALNFPQQLREIIASYLNENIAHIKKISYSPCGTHLYVCLRNGHVNRFPTQSGDTAENVDLLEDVTPVRDIQQIILGYAGTCWYEKQCAHCIRDDQTHTAPCTMSADGIYLASTHLNERDDQVTVFKNQAKEIENADGLTIEEI